MDKKRTMDTEVSGSISNVRKKTCLSLNKQMNEFQNLANLIKISITLLHKSVNNHSAIDKRSAKVQGV